jgi:hypothetical protein
MRQERLKWFPSCRRTLPELTVAVAPDRGAQM